MGGWASLWPVCLFGSRMYLSHRDAGTDYKKKQQLLSYQKESSESRVILPLLSLIHLSSLFSFL
jgi:hypothetical protein